MSARAKGMVYRMVQRPDVTGTAQSWTKLESLGASDGLCMCRGEMEDIVDKEAARQEEKRTSGKFHGCSERNEGRVSSDLVCLVSSVSFCNQHLESWFLPLPKNSSWSRLKNFFFLVLSHLFPLSWWACCWLAWQPGGNGLAWSPVSRWWQGSSAWESSCSSSPLWVCAVP